MDERKTRECYDIICDCWAFMRRHAKVEDTDAYWKSIVNESTEIYQQHDNSQFAKRILQDIIRELHAEVEGK